MPTIAVLGASSNRAKFGNKCVRAYAHAGYRVFPINPTEKEVEGFPAFAKLADVPEPLDRISVYLPPPVTLDYLDQIDAAQAGEVWLNPGAYDTAVLEAARGRGIPIRPGCSIVDIGLSPAMFGA